MSATPQSSLKIGCVVVALALASSSGLAADPVCASFDRMLAHEPMPAGGPAATRGPADPLIAALVLPLRDGAHPSRPVVPSDAVVESFTRMFNHEPNRTPPALPESAGADPLIAAIVRPLLQSHSYLVAGVTPPVRP